MPLVHIALRHTTPERIAAIRDGVYAALRASFEVPENDRFILVSQHEAHEFDYDPGYLGIARSDELVFVRINCSASRGVTQKKALYRDIVERLVQSPGLRPEDVFIHLVETARENWSFGHGAMQYA
ncbi:MAG TPA: tautomerase family protein [Stenotrophomonas sp.]|nr:tautomerase family protein [Stenotrophomonas sp.]